MDNSILKWLEGWYSNCCNEDWEHQYGILIDTIDNPGWHVEIDLVGTKYEHEEIKRILIDNGDDDWYDYRIENGKYFASGDPSKLTRLIEIFREFIENVDETTS